MVEIFKDGKSLTWGSTTVGHGSVSLSVDMVTGKASAPITSGNATVAKPSTTIKTTTVPAANTASAKPTTAVTASTTTVISTAAVNTTTAAP
jgi:hypothetical protein